MKKRTKLPILENVLVPEHVILREGEVENLLNMYEIKKEQIPKIKSSDPVIKEIGAKEGDVVKIIRRSRTVGKFLSYRLVIEG